MMMAKLRRIDSVQPCLLNRLTDDKPSVPNETAAQRTMSMQEYKEAVIRDLADLLNSKAPLDSDDVYDFAEVAESVLAYGVRDSCGVTSSDPGATEIEREFEHALRIFEPRIVSGSLSVRRIVSSTDLDPTRTLSLRIEGDLWAVPAPDHLFVKTELDMEMGHCEIEGLPNG